MTVIAQRPAFCHVEMFTVVGSTVQEPSQVLGRTTWAELHDLVAQQGGEQLPGNLFLVPNTDGTQTLYRATDEE